jgi:hypothetical protein
MPGPKPTNPGEGWEDRRAPDAVRRREALEAILNEREYQKSRWTQEHDKKHAKEEWMTILTVWLGKLASCVYPYASANDHEAKAGFKKRLIQIAAICLAAIEAVEEP